MDIHDLKYSAFNALNAVIGDKINTDHVVLEPVLAPDYYATKIYFARLRAVVDKPEAHDEIHFSIGRKGIIASRPGSSWYISDEESIIKALPSMIDALERRYKLSICTSSNNH